MALDSDQDACLLSVISFFSFSVALIQDFGMKIVRNKDKINHFFVSGNSKTIYSACIPETVLAESAKWKR